MKRSGDLGIALRSINWRVDMKKKLTGWLKLRSLKTRLALAAGACCVVLVIATGVTVQYYMKQFLSLEAQARLTISLDELLGQVDVDTTAETPTITLFGQLSEARFSQPYSGFYWQVQDQNSILKRSRSLWDTQLYFHRLTNQSGLSNFVIKGPNDTYVLVVQQRVKLPDSDAYYWLSIAQDMAPLQATVDQVRHSLFIGLGFLTVAIILVFVLQLSWGLRPLTTLREELSLIEAGLKDSFAHDYPSEINPLVQDINQLISHHKQSLEQARTNAGNMAHALKTPLSIMQNELMLESTERSELLQSQVQSMRQHIEYHLSASQLAAKRLLGDKQLLRAKCSPYAQCANAVSAFSRLYQDRHVGVDLLIDESLSVAVDHRDFDEMLGNLIENAYKWAQKRIVINARIKENTVLLSVEDDGPGMTEEECAWVINRGQRLDEQAPGHGLGMNIVSEMARVYQGELQLTRSDLGGLAATVNLPLRRS